jgi:hypothetical protein
MKKRNWMRGLGIGMGMGVAVAAVFCAGSVRGQEGGGAAGEAETEPEAEHLRFVEEEDGAARLETVVMRMAGPGGVVVDLVGAVHVGDAAYYEELNRRFKGYEAVLYELVGRPEAGKPLGNRAVEKDTRLGWIGLLQQKMKEVLKLEGQLEKIDYSAANFVHADMDMEAFQKIQGENRETFFGLWLKAMAAQQSAGGGGGTGSDLGSLVLMMQILMKEDSADDLKRLIGREFDQVETIMTGIEANGGTVIIGERNRVALEVFEREVKAGKKRLAVFYGAGHFPDMQRRLEEMGFEKAGQEWLTAWDIPAPKRKAGVKAAGEEGDKAGR